MYKKFNMNLLHLLLLSVISWFPYQLLWGQEIFEFEASSAQSIALVQTNKQFPTLSMLAQYRGEEKKGVRYLSEAERAQQVLHICDGRLCDIQGIPLNPSFKGPKETLSTFPKPQPKLSNKEQGYAIFVMNESGQIYFSFDAQAKHFHHSSLLAGRPVAAAGEMIVFQGKLYAINNQSGHYQPPPVVIERVISVLEKGGVSTRGVLIKRFGSDF